MLLLCKDKTINLNKFETVRIRESLIGEGFPVEAIRRESGFFGTSLITEEIIRFKNAGAAEILVKDITQKWGEKKDIFDVVKWIEEKTED